ncbi:MAG: hypothetical protein KF858_09015 [Candidatus Sumerlaeia bacterium]|nr:hypothetical protein [Candidatus Sumerlaeia bacterium]
MASHHPRQCPIVAIACLLAALVAPGLAPGDARQSSLFELALRQIETPVGVARIDRGTMHQPGRGFLLGERVVTTPPGENVNVFTATDDCLVFSTVIDLGLLTWKNRVYRFDFDAEKPVLLLDGGARYGLHGVSPSGDEILLTIDPTDLEKIKNETYQINIKRKAAILNLRSGAITVIADFWGEWAPVMRWSPDGTRVAMILQQGVPPQFLEWNRGTGTQRSLIPDGVPVSGGVLYLPDSSLVVTLSNNPADESMPWGNYHLDLQDRLTFLDNDIVSLRAATIEQSDDGEPVIVLTGQLGKARESTTPVDPFQIGSRRIPLDPAGRQPVPEATIDYWSGHTTTKEFEFSGRRIESRRGEHTHSLVYRRDGVEKTLLERRNFVGILTTHAHRAVVATQEEGAATSGEKQLVLVDMLGGETTPFYTYSGQMPPKVFLDKPGSRVQVLSPTGVLFEFDPRAKKLQRLTPEGAHVLRFLRPSHDWTVFHTLGWIDGDGKRQDGLYLVGADPDRPKRLPVDEASSMENLRYDAATREVLVDVVVGMSPSGTNYETRRVKLP